MSTYYRLINFQYSFLLLIIAIFYEITNVNSMSCNWVKGNMPAIGSYSSLAYGNGTFVAITDIALGFYNGSGAYSRDGINWHPTIISPKFEWGYIGWTGIAYGAGKFVAVGSGGIAYSANGIDWRQNVMLNLTLESVVYANGKFVAVSYDISASSIDGIKWQTYNLNPSQYIVGYGAGKFVAFGGYSNITAYSMDGINWNETAMPSMQSWCSVAYGNGKFIMISCTMSCNAYSTDGITWNAVNYSEGNMRSITYGGGLFVTVSDIGARYSADGINWSSAAHMPSSLGSLWNDVIYADGKFVAISDDRSAVCQP